MFESLLEHLSSSQRITFEHGWHIYAWVAFFAAGGTINQFVIVGFLERRALRKRRKQREQRSITPPSGVNSV